MKKTIVLLLVGCLMLTLAACAPEGTAVYVQSVAKLTGAGLLQPGDRFPGMVVSEKETHVQRDMDKSIAELLVKVGEDVSEGQALFSYDTDELQLKLDKQKLELEQLQAMIDNYTEQLAELEEEREDAPESDKLQYTVQIQTLQVDLKEAELNLAAKQGDITQSENILTNAVVFAPVSGRIQSISESGTDSMGNSTPYIVIQQAGSFRVQGSLGELQLGNLPQGSRVKVISRTDPEQFWMGVISAIDYENPSQGSNMDMMYGTGTDSLTSSSKYPFYVALESTEGLLLGQHVYLEPDTGTEAAGLLLPGAFIHYDDSGNPCVWADKNGGLELRQVSLGEYDPMTDAYRITQGLEESDYIAFPDAELCYEGAPTTREEPAPEEAPALEGMVG